MMAECNLTPAPSPPSVRGFCVPAPGDDSVLALTDDASAAFAGAGALDA
jgi:hypothetical protein